MKRFAIGLILLFGLCAQAGAAGCFWVGGTATWDAVNTGGGGTGGIKWASATGGGTACSFASGTSPGTGDSVTFDASSGGGTVTMSVDVSVQTFNWPAFTGTIDNSANKNVTMSGSTGFNGSGAGARTFIGGSGTYTLTSASATWFMATVTNLTNPTTAFASATITLSGVSTGVPLSFQGGGLTYGTVNFNANKGVNITGTNTFATFNITGINDIRFPQGSTTTITNAFAWTGTSSAPISIDSGNFTGGVATLTTGSATANTAAWAGFGRIVFTPVGGSTLVATNSFDFGLNSGTGFTITPPSTGGSRCIGC